MTTSWHMLIDPSNPLCGAHGQFPPLWIPISALTAVQLTDSGHGAFVRLGDIASDGVDDADLNIETPFHHADRKE